MSRLPHGWKATCQREYIDGELSEALTLEVGVPQGSSLGPILYCLMVNDLLVNLTTDILRNLIRIFIINPKARS